MAEHSGIRRLNRSAMLRALSDAEVALRELRREIADGEHDADGNLAFGVPFQYIVSQVCIAWNSRWLTDAEIAALSESDCDLMRDSIPNWGLQFQLADLDAPSIFNPPDAPV